MANAAITVDLNARIAQFETEIKRSTASLDGFGNKGSAALASLKSFGAGLAGALSVGAIASFAKAGIDAADSLNDMSQRLGVSVKDLASFKLAAEQSGTSLDGVGAGIARLSKSIGEAEGGNKKLAGALGQLGITARDPKEAFFQLADAVQRIEDPSQRAALLSQVLGKSYGELVPLLAQGGDELRKSARESESFADAMARLAPNADQFNDALATLKNNAAAAAAKGLIPLVEALNRTFERFEALGRLRGAGASLFEIVTGGISADYKKSLDRVNADIADLEAKRKRLGTVRNPADDAELARLKAIRAELQAIAVESINRPPASAASAGASSGSGAATECGRTLAGKGKTFDAEAMRIADLADAWKEADAELKRYADDRAFVLEGDLERDNAVNAISQEWIEAGRALHESVKTPLETLEDRLGYIDELMRRGVISVEDYGRAYAQALDDGNAKAEKAKSLAEEFGIALTDGLENAIASGENLSDVLGSLEQTLAKLIIRKTITAPLMSAIDGIDFGSLFPFANGGIMTSAGPLPLNRYASGGIASTPQLALFGEGSTNEAFVPLPDGRHIPVRMTGGGNVQINIIESAGNGGKTERRQDSNGGNVLDIYVEQIKASIAGDISRGRGTIPQSMQSAYGLNRVAGAY